MWLSGLEKHGCFEVCDQPSLTAHLPVCGSPLSFLSLTDQLSIIHMNDPTDQPYFSQYPMCTASFTGNAPLEENLQT